MNANELSTLKKARINIEPPKNESMAVGLLGLERNNPKFTFKCVTANSVQGQVCTSSSIPVIKEHLQRVGITYPAEAKVKKEDLCKELMIRYFEENKLYMWPYFKPKQK
jgi:hypothetical protein